MSAPRDPLDERPDVYLLAGERNPYELVGRARRALVDAGREREAERLAARWERLWPKAIVGRDPDPTWETVCRLVGRYCRVVTVAVPDLPPAVAAEAARLTRPVRR